MISVFQIFRVLMGVIVFIFVLTFFLRVSDMYSSTQERGSLLETVNAFDHAAMQVYTSGNPTTFPGFEGFETLVYEAPKIKHDAGQKTLSVPVFFVPGTGEIMLERRCLDFGWYRWCMVLAFPKGTKVLFTPIENTQQTRDLIVELVDNLPSTIEFGICDGNGARTADKEGFLSYIAGSAGTEYQPCDVQLPEHYRLVTINSTWLKQTQENQAVFHTIIEPSSGIVYDAATGRSDQPRPYHDWMDIAVFITGGHRALDYKQAVFTLELEAATGIMHQRTVLVSQKTKELNRQPCLECSTPLPEACGWTDYRGMGHESQIYKDFISSLLALKGAMGGSYHSQLDGTVIRYDELKSRGCE
ncbi:MAG: hypothetical protein JXC85_03350 [Candidatus Aenigmarchaeota archaeon]|nr:hypothetical protein [Candidatus Aenigmarchaeota archaeon]